MSFLYKMFMSVKFPCVLGSILSSPFLLLLLLLLLLIETLAKRNGTQYTIGLVYVLIHDSKLKMYTPTQARLCCE